MVFPKSDFVIAGIVCPAAIFVGLIVGASSVSRYLAAKNHTMKTIIIFWLIIIGFILYMLFTYSSCLIYPISASLQPNATQYITVGCVEQIDETQHQPIYFNPFSRELCSAKFLTVNDMLFYVPYCNIEVGQNVKLRWATEERVVYEYYILTNADNESYTHPIAIHDDPLHRDTHEQMGRSIATICACLFLLIVVLQYPLGKKIRTYFLKKDKEVVGTIIPNLFGLLYVCVLFLPIFGILVGLALTGFTGVIIIFLIGITNLAWLVVKKQTTTVTIDAEMLTIKDLSSTHCIEKSDIVAVDFVMSRLPYNRCLMLTLKNGTIFRFEQENFYGLESMYKNLRKLSE